MKRVLSQNDINEKIKEIYNTLTSTKDSHEQKVTYLARHAENFLTVLDEPEGLSELMRCDVSKRCICNLFEGEAPYRPRYICVDFKKFLENGSDFLSLKKANTFREALTNLMILYHNIPSITNYPVYIGDLDKLLSPYIEGLTDEEIKESLRLWFLEIDRTILDSFCHADIGPEETRIGNLILEVEGELNDAVPNITMRVSKKTPDSFIKKGVETSLKCAKPSFANDNMFRSELGNEYCIASCYNGLIEGGGSYTLVRLVLTNVAKRVNSIKEFKESELPRVLDIMARYMDERIRFLVEESNFFESNFLVREGLIDRKKFTAMFGMVGLAECVNTLLEKDYKRELNKEERFGRGKEADKLGVDIMDIINDFVNKHENKYCEVTNNHFLLHAQVGIDSDINISPGTRIPVGEEPDEIIDQFNSMSHYHKYFVSGTGDIFPVDMTVHKNPEYVMDLIKGSFSHDNENGIRYLSFYSSDSDVVRVTGYLVKRSEIEKLNKGIAVRQNTTGLGKGAKENCKALDRRIR